MPQLSFEIIYQDETVTEILAAADNGRFAGCARIYIDPNDLIELGKQIKGFPQKIDQVENREFGFSREEKEKFEDLRKINPAIKSYSTAYLSMNFYCIDSSGHSAVHLTFNENTWSKRAAAAGKASFELMIEPAQIDRFAEELIKMGSENFGKAVLSGIHDSRENFA